MNSRLQRVDDWVRLAHRANYQPGEVAALCAVSLRQLERFCKGTFYLTPHAWLRAMRLRQAKKLLAEGSTPKATAYELGFKQLSHFSREFKRHTGCAPTAFLPGAALNGLSRDVASE